MVRATRESVTVNIGGGVRFDRLHGRRMLVAPVAMMKEGVWAGSDGPLLYTAKHLRNACPSWNNKPIMGLAHPKKGGRPVSAGDPNVIEEQEIGRVLNAHFDNKQRAEAWIDIERANEVEPRIMQKLAAGEIIEVSTGLFVDQKPRDGVYNNKAYKAIASNHRPDHLAILVDEEGACSVADGAGLMQINARSKRKSTRNSKGTAMANTVFNKRIVVDELIDNSVGWEDSDRDFLLGCTKNQLSKMLAQVVTNEDEDEELEDEELDEAEFEFVENAAEDEDEDEEDEESEEDETEDDDDVDYQEVDADELEANAKKKGKKKIGKVPANGFATGAAPATKKGSGGKQAPGAMPTLCSREQRDIYEIGLQTVNAKRRDLIAVINENPGNMFSKKQLRGFEISELEALAALSRGGMAEPIGNGGRFAPDYSGAAGGAFPIANSRGGADDGELLSMPTINFNNDGEDEDPGDEDDETPRRRRSRR